MTAAVLATWTTTFVVSYSGPVGLAILCVAILLLCVRAWSATIKQSLTRWAAFLLDGGIVVLVLMFAALVVGRFEILA